MAGDGARRGARWSPGVAARSSGAGDDRSDGSISERGTDSYYGRPVIKEPVWKPEIPWYFFTGGLAGASSVLCARRACAGNERLARTALLRRRWRRRRPPVLLVADLGRPERFLNMLRVFKVTSPMSVGRGSSP